MVGKLQHTIGILASPLGPHHVERALILSIRHILLPLAGIYRRIFLGKTRIAAVVGTFGKTTTTRALKAALMGETDPQSNWNPESGVALEMLRMRPGRERAVFEAGVHRPGRMGRFAWMIRPEIALVTSIGSEHHTFFGTIETTAKEKGAMARALPPSGLAILNGDCPEVLAMKDEIRARVVTFGFGEDNDVRAEGMELDWPQGMRLHIRGFEQRRTLRVRLIGWPMACAILGAVAAALAEGLSLDEIVPRMEALSPSTGRLEPVALPSGAWVVRDEFKASIETVEAALDTMADIPAPRRIVVLGKVFKPKEEEGRLYERLGARVASFADRAVFVGDTVKGRAGAATAAQDRRCGSAQGLQ
jgi:UDP-N-acetylmuramyl pentapeptide synthase